MPRAISSVNLARAALICASRRSCALRPNDRFEEAAHVDEVLSRPHVKRDLDH